MILKSYSWQPISSVNFFFKEKHLESVKSAVIIDTEHPSKAKVDSGRAAVRARDARLNVPRVPAPTILHLAVDSNGCTSKR